MRVFTVLSKNLKLIARSKFYFIILIICPIGLIFSSSIMFNAIDYENVVISVYSDKANSSLENISSNVYPTFESCLDSVIKQASSACIKERGGDFAIYYDNSNIFIESAIKQKLLAEIVKIQRETINASLIQSEITLTTMVDAIDELESHLLILKEDFKVYKDEVLPDVTKEISNTLKLVRESKKDLEKVDSLRNTYLGNSDGLTAPRNNYQNFLRFWSRYNGTNNSQVDDIVAPLANQSDDLGSQMNGTAENYAAINEILQSTDGLKEDLDELEESLEDIQKDMVEVEEKLDDYYQEIEIALDKIEKLKADMSSFKQTGLYGDYEFVPAFNYSKDPIYKEFPLLIALIITFSSLVLSNMFILKQVNSKSYFRECIAPTSTFSFILGNYLTILISVLIQAVTVFIIGTSFFGLETQYFGEYILITFLVSSIFIFMGMSIAYFVRSQSLSILITIFILMLSIMMSDIVAPSTLISFLPKLIILLFNIFNIFYNLMTKLIILNKGFPDFFLFLLYLAAYLFVFLFVAAFGNKWSKISYFK